MAVDDRVGFVMTGAAVAGQIPGPLPNKSNCRQIVKIRGRLMVIKSKAARDLERMFLSADKSGLRGLPLPGRLELKAVVFQKDMRRDLDIELIPDLLQKAGIIENDRQIWKKTATRYIDKNCPRTLFTIGEMEGTP